MSGTGDRVAVDDVRLAVLGDDNADALRAALKQAHGHDGLSVAHVPVYCEPDELGGLGAWSRWNVGNWCADVQDEWIRQDLSTPVSRQSSSCRRAPTL